MKALELEENHSIKCSIYRDIFFSRYETFNSKLAVDICLLSSFLPHSPAIRTSYSNRRWRNNFKLPLSMCEVHFYYYQESLNRFPFFLRLRLQNFSIFFPSFSSADCWWEKRRKILSDFFHYYLFSK